MADPEKQWSIREDGCLSVDINTSCVTYNSSLNLVILSSRDQSITVLDALSGAFLQKSNLSGKNGEENETTNCSRFIVMDDIMS